MKDYSFLLFVLIGLLTTSFLFFGFSFETRRLPELVDPFFMVVLFKNKFIKVMGFFFIDTLKFICM